MKFRIAHMIPLAAVQILALQGCAQMASNAMQPMLEKEHQKQTGYYGESAEKICSPKNYNDFDVQANERVECAERNNDLAVVGKTISRYSTYDGKVESACSFIGNAATLVPSAISGSIGLLQPTLSINSDGQAVPDWKTTERLHNVLRTKLKLKLLPLSESKKYHEYMNAWFFEEAKKITLVSSTLNFRDNRYYDKVLKRFDNLGYVIAPSNASYPRITDQNSVDVKMMQAIEKKNPALTTAKEMQDYSLHNSSLVSILRSAASDNNREATMEFDLVSKFREMSPNSGGILSVDMDRPSCISTDLSLHERLKQAQLANEKNKEAEGRSGVSGIVAGLKNSMYVDTSQGLEIGMDARRDNARKMENMKKDLADSLKEYSDSRTRFVQRHESLITFSSKAFSKMEIPGYISSTKLK